LPRTGAEPHRGNTMWPSFSSYLPKKATRQTPTRANLRLALMLAITQKT
jgi:hypothetical protein